jgi:hypothetical protein
MYLWVRCTIASVTILLSTHGVRHFTAIGYVSTNGKTPSVY